MGGRGYVSPYDDCLVSVNCVLSELCVHTHACICFKVMSVFLSNNLTSFTKDGRIPGASRYGNQTGTEYSSYEGFYVSGRVIPTTLNRLYIMRACPKRVMYLFINVCS